MKILKYGFVIVFVITTSLSAKAQISKEQSALAILNIKQGYNCNKAIMELRVALDSIASKMHRKDAAFTEIMRLNGRLEQNNNDLIFNNKSYKNRDFELKKKLKKSKKGKKALEITVGALLLLIGLSL